MYRKPSALLRLALVGALLAVAPAAAQAPETAPVDRTPRPSLWTLSKGVLSDPTTYTPGILSYESQRLDWRSSQVFFTHGYVEANRDFTRSGRPDDLPVSYGEGHRRIVREALGVFAGSAVHNLTARVIERSLLEQYPRHRTLIRTLGWIERGAVGSYVSYRVSAAHFRQWQHNRRLAQEQGW